jgi:SAM-dependent methyltransferase
MTRLVVRAAHPRAPHPLAVYAAALRRAAAGQSAGLAVVDGSGRSRPFSPAAWCKGLLDGDHGLLRRCAGSTLDVGCGPGRLAAALASRGDVALGVDACAEAVRLARRRGAPALLADVFEPLPREGRWRRVLLVDGNIGIGGDPTRLLRRCRTLTAPTGEILVEVDPPGTASWSGPVRITTADGATSGSFPWAFVNAGTLAQSAADAGLRIRGAWTEVGRWFASLGRG